MVYIAFVIDVFARRIVGWRVSTSMTTGFVLNVLNQAICQRVPSGAEDLIHHSDRGSQYLSIKYTERLVDAGIAPSVGSVGDSYDKALAESTIGPVQARSHRLHRVLEICRAGRMGNPEMGELNRPGFTGE